MASNNVFDNLTVEQTRDEIAEAHNNETVMMVAYDKNHEVAEVYDMILGVMDDAGIPASELAKMCYIPRGRYGRELPQILFLCTRRVIVALHDVGFCEHSNNAVVGADCPEGVVDFIPETGIREFLVKKASHDNGGWGINDGGKVKFVIPLPKDMTLSYVTERLNEILADMQPFFPNLTPILDLPRGSRSAKSDIHAGKGYLTFDGVDEDSSKVEGEVLDQLADFRRWLHGHPWKLETEDSFVKAVNVRWYEDKKKQRNVRNTSRMYDDQYSGEYSDDVAARKQHRKHHNRHGNYQRRERGRKFAHHGSQKRRGKKNREREQPAVETQGIDTSSWAATATAAPMVSRQAIADQIRKEEQERASAEREMLKSQMEAQMAQQQAQMQQMMQMMQMMMAGMQAQAAAAPAQGVFPAAAATPPAPAAAAPAPAAPAAPVVPSAQPAFSAFSTQPPPATQ